MSPSVGLKSFTVSSPDTHIKMSFPLPPLNVSFPGPEIIVFLPFPSSNYSVSRICIISLSTIKDVVIFCSNNYISFVGTLKWIDQNNIATNYDY